MKDLVLAGCKGLFWGLAFYLAFQTIKALSKKKRLEEPKKTVVIEPRYRVL